MSPYSQHSLQTEVGCARDVSGGPVVKNPPHSAGDMGLISVRGIKIPHAAGQLNPWATATELVRLN